jgi:MoxR-like ATPase
MEEHQVTVSGTTFRLEEPFFVIATQNPIEMEGTFPLPEAQLDRFLFKIFIGYPSSEELSQILRQTTVAELSSVNPVLPPDRAQAWILSARRLVREVLVASPIEGYVVRLVSATRPSEDGTENPATRFLRYGASPRGAQAILMGAKVLALIKGRVNVSFDDVDRLILPALNHRVVLSFEAEADKRTAPDILTELTDPLRASR